MSEERHACQTCERIRQLKEQGEYYANARPTRYKTTSICKVALVVEDYYDIDGELEKGGRVSYNPMIIKFCPECARKISEDEIIW